MSDTTEIEKKSLEAHVELCAERYRLLELKLATVEQDVCDVKTVTQETNDLVHRMSERRNTQLINWGIGVIVFLASSIGYLLSHYVFK